MVMYKLACGDMLNKIWVHTPRVQVYNEHGGFNCKSLIEECVHVSFLWGRWDCINIFGILSKNKVVDPLKFSGRRTMSYKYTA